MATTLSVLQEVGKDKMKYKNGDIVESNLLLEIDEEVTKKHTHGYYWKVQCLQCGKIRSVRTDNLKRKCMSCAAKNRTDNKNILIIDNLIGKEFGNWKVLYKADKQNYWHCKCMKCGTERDVFRGNLTQGLSKGCGCQKSWGEAQLIYLLDKNNISYKREYAFIDLISDKGGHPRFDFSIWKNNELYCLIEYDGRQHFNYNNNWKMSSEDFERLKYLDELKNQYCKDNNILLYRLNNSNNLELFISQLLLGINK